MLNIPKENVKPFVAVVAGLAIMIIITLIIDFGVIHKSVFKKDEPDLAQYNNTAESKVEENKYNLVSEERRILFYTDEIMAMINNKEFEKLYNILDEQYRNIYVKSVEDLEKYMSRFSDGEYSLAYDEYYKEGNMFLIDVRFQKTDLDRQDIINGVKYPIDTLCIREIEKGKYTVAFNGFISKKEYNTEVSNGLVKLKLKDVTIRSDSTEILVYMENLTNEKVTLYESRLDICLLHAANHKFVDPNTITKELQPNEKTLFRLSFKNIYCKDSEPKKLKLNKIYSSEDNRKKLEIKL